MYLCSFTIIKTFQQNQHTLSLASITLARFLHTRMFCYSSSSSFALPVHLPRQVPFLVFFSFLFFVSVFGLLLGAFWVPFWLLVGLFFWVFSHRFFNHIPGRFWAPFWVHFGTVLGSKIDLGGARGRKGGSSKTSVLLKENHTFRAWTSPGAPQIHLGTAPKFEQEFL